MAVTVVSLDGYIEWLKAELRKKASLQSYGDVTLSFRIQAGQITDVRKESVETEHYAKRD